MNKLFKVCPLGAIPTDAPYSLVLGSVGFEGRSRFALKKLLPASTRRLAIRFEDRQILEFGTNEKFFASAGYDFLDPELSYLNGRLKAVFEKTSVPSNVLVDISSMTRGQLATICSTFYGIAIDSGLPLVIDFVYSHAKYSDPPVDFGPIQFRGPVLPEFSGWSPELELPTALVLGVGYEPDISLGLSEEMEPGKIIVFRPARHDERYSVAIDAGNKELLHKIPVSNLFDYDVFDWYGSYLRLVNVVNGLHHDCRVTLVPLGPKIFSLACILCGLDWYPSVSVWRVSAAEFGDPINRIADGRLSFLRLKLNSLE